MINPRFSEVEFESLRELLATYEWGAKVLMTKLEIIHDDLRNFRENGAIDHIRHRIKTPESIARKLSEKGLPITVASVAQHLQDIAGIRIITPFGKDIYFLADIIRSIPDISILAEKNFVSTPKPSGYRSYHLVVSVPVFYSGEVKHIPVEVQIRTEAMNFWASLEHKARYKYQQHVPTHLSNELILIADKIAELDDRMYLIHDLLSLINQDNARE